MPADGFKTITVTDEFYAHWFRIFKKSKKELKTRGINSFSSFIAHKLSETET